MAAGKLFAESSKTADWARWSAIVRTDFDEVDVEEEEFEVDEADVGSLDEDGCALVEVAAA